MELGHNKTQLISFGNFICELIHCGKKTPGVGGKYGISGYDVEDWVTYTQKNYLSQILCYEIIRNLDTVIVGYKELNIDTITSLPTTDGEIIYYQYQETPKERIFKSNQILYANSYTIDELKKDL